MLAVLDLDPVLLSAATVWALAMLRDQALQPHLTRGAEQVRTDLAALEWRDTMFEWVPFIIIVMIALPMSACFVGDRS